MKKIVFAISAVLLSLGVNAQRERDNWIFGGSNNGTPALGFNISQNQITSLNNNNTLGDFQGHEGYAVASDPRTGQLLFYTDGNTLYDGNHNDVTPNGGLGASPSAAQGVTICTVPICPYDRYYVFSNSLNSTTYRIYNSTNGSFGPSVALPMPQFFDNSRLAESSSIIPNPQDPNEFWLVTKGYFDQPLSGAVGAPRVPVYLVHRINANGISPPQVYSFGTSYLPSTTSPGSYISQSTYSFTATNNPNTAKIAWAHNRWLNGRLNEIWTVDFDATTGVINTASANRETTAFRIAGGTNALYDVEFSPNGNFLYYSFYNDVSLYQHNLLQNVSTLVQNFAALDSRPIGGGLQTGSDGNIYMVYRGGPLPVNGTGPSRTIVGRITSPNTQFVVGGANPTVFANFFQSNIYTRPGVWGMNLPEFATTPLWRATVDIAEGEACPGEPTQIETEINTLGVEVTGYRWYKDGVLIQGEESDELRAIGPGLYRIEVLLDGSGACSIMSDEARIEESENCCFIEDHDDEFKTVYDDHVTITDNTIWDHKVIIKDGIRVTIDGAILDVTNVDVVFGNCAGIDFINGAVIRSNNSVYRPCNYLSSWRGLRFDESTDGVFNECTFKNALMALHFDDRNNQQDVVTVRVTNNLFSNCSEGIHIEGALFERNISGNTFQIGEDAPEVFCSMGATQYTGIRIEDSDFDGGQVAQNDFNMGKQNSSIGIRLNRSSDIEFISNNFLNFVGAFSFQNGSDLKVKSNKITFTPDFFGNSWSFGYGMSIRTTSNSEFSNNILEMDSELNDFNYRDGVRSSMLFRDCSGINISGNNIINFESGVDIRNSSNIDIIDNTMKDSWFYGVYAEDLTNALISCNNIQMESKENAFVSTGIGLIHRDNFFLANASNGNTISSNCIKESDVAIFSRGIGAGQSSTAPVIRNNYLYNYMLDGVLLDNVNGTNSLGTAATNQLASKNTFVSNNNGGGSFDVRVINAPVVTVVGSSGINTTNGGVIITSNNSFVSTASCGNQQGIGLNSIMEDLDYCEPRDLNQAQAPLFRSQESENESKIQPTYARVQDKRVEIEGTSINLYPNPSSDKVTVSLINAESDAVVLTLVNSHGQQLISKTIEANVMEYTLDVSNFAAGYYVVTILDGNGVQKRAKLLID